MAETTPQADNEAKNEAENAVVDEQTATPTPAEETMPVKTFTLVLHDKTGLTLEDVVYFSTDLGRVEVLQKKLARLG